MNYDFTGADFESPDLDLVGDAQWVDNAVGNPPSFLRLTSAGPNQSGSAWINNLVLDPGGDWGVQFEVRISGQGGIVDDAENDGGNGFSFFLQTAGTAVNPGGEGVPSNKFLAVHFDTFRSGADAFDNVVEVVSHAGPIGTIEVPAAPTPLGEAGGPIIFTFGYSPSLNELTWSFDLQQVIGSISMNMVDVFGPLGLTYVGLSADTGDAYQNHDFRSLVVAGEMSPVVVPEPSSFALLAAGLLIAISLLRRRALNVVRTSGCPRYTASRNRLP